MRYPPSFCSIKVYNYQSEGQVVSMSPHSSQSNDKQDCLENFNKTLLFFMKSSIATKLWMCHFYAICNDIGWANLLRSGSRHIHICSMIHCSMKLAMKCPFFTFYDHWIFTFSFCGISRPPNNYWMLLATGLLTSGWYIGHWSIHLQLFKRLYCGN